MDSQQQVAHFMAAMMPAIILFGLIAVALYIIPLWRICTKAGLSGPLSLIALIPGIGKLIALYIIAFSDWRVGPAPNGSMLPPPGGYPPATYPASAYPPGGYPPAAPPQS